MQLEKILKKAEACRQMLHNRARLKRFAERFHGACKLAITYLETVTVHPENKTQLLPSPPTAIAVVRSLVRSLSSLLQCCPPSQQPAQGWMQIQTSNGESAHVLELLSRLLCPHRRVVPGHAGTPVTAGVDGDYHSSKLNNANDPQALFGEVTRVLRTAVRTLGIFLVEKVPVERSAASSPHTTPGALTKSVRVTSWALQLGVSLATRIRCRYDLEYADSPDMISNLLSSTPVVVEVLKCVQELLHKAAERPFAASTLYSRLLDVHLTEALAYLVLIQFSQRGGETAPKDPITVVAVRVIARLLHPKGPTEALLTPFPLQSLFDDELLSKKLPCTDATPFASRRNARTRMKLDRLAGQQGNLRDDLVLTTVEALMQRFDPGEAGSETPTPLINMEHRLDFLCHLMAHILKPKGHTTTVPIAVEAMTRDTSQSQLKKTRTAILWILSHCCTASPAALETVVFHPTGVLQMLVSSCVAELDTTSAAGVQQHNDSPRCMLPASKSASARSKLAFSGSDICLVLALGGLAVQLLCDEVAVGREAGENTEVAEDQLRLFHNSAITAILMHESTAVVCAAATVLAALHDSECLLPNQLWPQPIIGASPCVGHPGVQTKMIMKALKHAIVQAGSQTTITARSCLRAEGCEFGVRTYGQLDSALALLEGMLESNVEMIDLATVVGLDVPLLLQVLRSPNHDGTEMKYNYASTRLSAMGVLCAVKCLELQLVHKPLTTGGAGTTPSMEQGVVVACRLLQPRHIDAVLRSRSGGGGRTGSALTLQYVAHILRIPLLVTPHATSGISLSSLQHIVATEKVVTHITSAMQMIGNPFKSETAG